jgi:hypothetical protein
MSRDSQWQVRAESVAGAVFTCGLSEQSLELAYEAASRLAPFSHCEVSVDEIPPRHLRGVALGVVD